MLNKIFPGSEKENIKGLNHTYCSCGNGFYF